MKKVEQYWWEIIGSAADPELIGFLLYEHGGAGLDWTVSDELRCYFYGTAAEQQNFLTVARSLGFNAIHSERLPIKDWGVDARNDWEPVKIGKLTLTPLIEPDSAEPLPSTDQFELFIHAASGFGTGHHVTTRATLELLLTLEGAKVQSLLDVGTGSGILAMAGCRLFDCSAYGIDQDEVALGYARKNLFYNGFKDRIVLSTEPIAAVRSTFDLILVNVYSEFHQQNEQEYVRLLNPSGHIILSGIARETRADLERLFDPRWVIQNTLEYGRWITHILRKK